MAEKIALTMEALKELVVSVFAEKVKELGLDRVDRKHAIFPDVDTLMGRKRFTPETYAAAGNFFRGLILKDARYNEIKLEGAGSLGAFWKDLSVTTPESGGYLVPTEFHAEVIQELVKRPVLRNICQVMPISAKDEIPTMTGKPTLYWPGENTAPSASAASFGTLSLSAKLALGYVPMSRRLAANPKLDVVKLLVNAFADVIGAGEDAVIVNGTGTGQPKGFRNVAYTIEAVPQAGASIAADDLIDLYHALPSQYRANASWCMRDSVIQKVRKLKETTTGNYLWTSGLSGAPATILGRPVLEQNDIPGNLGSGSPANESEIWFGDFKFYILGDAETMSVETTTEGGEAFTKHQVIVKVWEEIDGAIAVENAFRKLTGVK